jgi:2,3,4,5-tetrahydropyridine-2-carboxylate N-succinyltransferase
MTAPPDAERALVEAAFADRALLKDAAHSAAVERTLAKLDRGELRVASPPAPSADGDEGGEWTTHAWIKQAILLYFAIRGMETFSVGPFEFHDKIPLKKDLAAQNVRVVPPGVVRYGAFCEPGVIVMPGYVNIGARVGAGSMVDTWATVGSCAQIGKDCHLSGGVGIGGVLEPPGARPVIVEDGAFIGSRVVIVEGVHVGKEAVIGTGVVLTSTTAIYDVSGSEVVEHRGRVPARSVVIPGTRPKKFPAGEFGVPCALIIGKRTASTDRKVSLNDALRDFAVPV